MTPHIFQIQYDKSLADTNSDNLDIGVNDARIPIRMSIIATEKNLIYHKVPLPWMNLNMGKQVHQIKCLHRQHRATSLE